MPRRETILSIFLSSPSNVSEERATVRKIVAWINSTLTRYTGVRLELLEWEEFTSPQIAKDPQSVINDQIPQDYDIYLGILWHTVGTQTARAESGTIEEFEKAKQRHDNDESSVRLMLYFRESAPPSLDDIEPKQLEKAQEFRSRVGGLGLYRKYKTIDEFDGAVRRHLTEIVMDQQPQAEQDKHQGMPEVEVEDASTNDDEGLFELEEIFEAEMRGVGSVLNRMADAVVDIGDQIRQGTRDLRRLQAEGKVSRTAMKRILLQSSSDLNNFADVTNMELPLYRRHLERGIASFAKAVPIYLELNADTKNVKGTVSKLSKSMGSMLESIEKFRDTVRGVPRMTSDLNRSKRAAAEVLQHVIDITRDGKTSLDGILAFFA